MTSGPESRAMTDASRIFCLEGKTAVVTSAELGTSA